MLLLALGAATALALEGLVAGALRFLVLYGAAVILLARPGSGLDRYAPLLILFYLLQFLLTFLPLVVVFLAVTARVDVNRLIHALTAMRVPRTLVLPVAVVFRFVPALLEEWGHIRDAMRLRGLAVGPAAWLRRPARTIELVLVPLLMRSTKIADELSASALTRCIDAPGKKTIALPLRFAAGDGVVLLLTLAWAAAVILVDRFGAEWFPT
jgi:energy-coupling factor transport system permease protein